VCISGCDCVSCWAILPFVHPSILSSDCLLWTVGTKEASWLKQLGLETGYGLGEGYMYVIMNGHQEEQEGGRKCNGQRSRRRTLWMKEDKNTYNYEESDQWGNSELHAAAQSG